MGKPKGSKGAGRTPVMVLAALAIGAAASPARATVYEIERDGSVRIAGSDPTPSAASPETAPEVPAAAVTLIAEPSVPADYREPLVAASSRYELSPRLLAALARQESAWRPSIVSPKGAVGLTQLMPATARALAVDPRDPAANLAGGAHYFRQLLDRFNGNIEQALAAYNAGPGRVARAMGIPAIAETRAYVAGIVDRLGVAAISQGGR